MFSNTQLWLMIRKLTAVTHTNLTMTRLSSESLSLSMTHYVGQPLSAPTVWLTQKHWPRCSPWSTASARICSPRDPPPLSAYFPLTSAGKIQVEVCSCSSEGASVVHCQPPPCLDFALQRRETRSLYYPLPSQSSYQSQCALLVAHDTRWHQSAPALCCSGSCHVPEPGLLLCLMRDQVVQIGLQKVASPTLSDWGWTIPVRGTLTSPGHQRDGCFWLELRRCQRHMVWEVL